MSSSSLLGGDSAATRASGRDTDALGPSDNSDSGSDSQGERSMSTGADTPDELGALPVELDSDSDSTGTGERGAAGGDSARDGGDILPDHIVGDESVDSDEAFDAGSADNIDDIADDEEDEDGEGDAAPNRSSVERAIRAAAADAKADPEEAGTEAHGGRVFRVPAGTLEEDESR